MNETFETYRPYLFAIAYRMLGSAMDAEDRVQETSLRYQATSPGTILSLKAYLTTIISRLCVDQLHLAGASGSNTWVHGCRSRLSPQMRQSWLGLRSAWTNTSRSRWPSW